MVIIEYSTDGESIADLLVTDWINNLISTLDFSEHTEIKIGTSVMVDAIRVAIKEKRINSLDVVFKFNNQLISCNPEGKIHCWPKGFCDMTMIHLSKLAKK